MQMHVASNRKFRACRMPLEFAKVTTPNNSNSVQHVVHNMVNMGRNVNHFDFFMCLLRHLFFPSSCQDRSMLPLINNVDVSQENIIIVVNEYNLFSNRLFRSWIKSHFVFYPESVAIFLAHTKNIVSFKNAIIIAPIYLDIL